MEQVGVSRQARIIFLCGLYVVFAVVFISAAVYFANELSSPYILDPSWQFSSYWLSYAAFRASPIPRFVAVALIVVDVAYSLFMGGTAISAIGGSTTEENLARRVAFGVLGLTPLNVLPILLLGDD
jgi:hypothetical protein